MALSLENIPIKVRALLAARGQDVSNLRSPRILALVSDALEVMSHRAAKSEGYEGLQKDFSVTPTSGVIDLTSIATIIFDIARSRVRVASTNVPLYAVDSLETLVNAGLPTDKVIYAQDGTDLHFRDIGGTLNTYATALKIKANHVLTLATVPAQYEDMFIETLAGLVGGQVPEMRAREMAANTRA